MTHSVNITSERFTVQVGIQDTGEGVARCGVKFNPDGNYDVTVIKGISCVLMDYLELRRQACIAGKDYAGVRCFATAMTKLEASQMFAVKGLFTKQNADEENDRAPDNDSPATAD